MKWVEEILIPTAVTRSAVTGLPKMVSINLGLAVADRYKKTVRIVDLPEKEANICGRNI